MSLKTVRAAVRSALDTTADFQVDPLAEANKAPDKEGDARRLEQRQKQIDYGKNTLGYTRYIEAVPRHKRRRQGRKPIDPVTPDIHQVCSKRSFDGQVRQWRRMLHDWDEVGDGEAPVPISAPAPADKPEACTDASASGGKKGRPALEPLRAFIAVSPPKQTKPFGTGSGHIASGQKRPFSETAMDISPAPHTRNNRQRANAPLAATAAAAGEPAALAAACQEAAPPGNVQDGGAAKSAAPERSRIAAELLPNEDSWADVTHEDAGKQPASIYDDWDEDEIVI